MLLALELLKSGADPARRTSTGVVALHYLVSRQYTDDRDRQLLQELLPLLGDVNAQARLFSSSWLMLPPTHTQNNMLETPLSIAVSPSVAGPADTGVVRWLVEHRADVNHVDDQGETLLAVAITKRHREKVAVLLECHADPAFVSARRLTTGTEVARQTQDPAIMAMIMDPLNASEVLAKYTQEQSQAAKKKEQRPISTATKPWLFVLDHLYHLHNKLLPSLAQDPAVAQVSPC